MAKGRLLVSNRFKLTICQDRKKVVPLQRETDRIHIPD